MLATERRSEVLAEIKQGRKHLLSEEDLEWFYRSGKKRLRVVPLELKEANELVASLHRHHKPIQGHRFSIGVEDEDGRLVGAATVGRPSARLTNKKHVLEVTRCVTDGTPNACSALYAAAVRIGREMGYRKIQTFILESESGDSLRATGYERDGESRGGSWSRKERLREDKHPTEPKVRWSKNLGKGAG